MKMVWTMPNVLVGMATCEIVLTNICGGASVDILLMCNGNSVESDTIIDWGPWCRCSWLVENHVIPIR